MASGGPDNRLAELSGGPDDARLQRHGPSLASPRAALNPSALLTTYTLGRLSSSSMSDVDKNEYEIDQKDAKGLAGVTTETAVPESREPESLRDVSEADLAIMDRKLTRKMVSHDHLPSSRRSMLTGA
jgi:hypothetical protein